MRKDMKKCPKPLGYGIRRTPVVLGLSAALCMPAAFSYANVDNGIGCSIKNLLSGSVSVVLILAQYFLLCKEKQSKDKSWMKQESL